MAQLATSRLWWARCNTPELPFAITAVLIALFLFGMLHRTWEPADFIIAGQAVTDPASLPTAIPVAKDAQGFEGQFFYRLALNPFTRRPTAYGITLNNPPLRQQRILYPLLTWLAAFGQPQFVPALLVYINFFALCLLGWLGGIYARSLGRHALWGLLLSLYPGFLISLRCDLAEVLEICLLLGSLLLLRRARHRRATLLLVLAILTKETALLVVLAAALVYGLARWRGRVVPIKWFYFAVPMLIFIVWQTVLGYVWGELPMWVDRGGLGVPLLGFVRLCSAAVRRQTTAPLRTCGELLVIVGFALTVLSQFRSTAAAAFEKFSWLAYALLSLALNGQAWIVDWNFLRALSEFYVLGALVIIGGKTPVRAMTLAAIVVLWLAQAYRLIAHIL
jgi:hypothetical protein